MKITIYNPNNQVQFAKSDCNDLSLSVLVDFRDRWPDYFWITGSTVELFVYNEPPVDDEYKELDKVIFEPENDLEKELLSCIKFDLLNKDQLWALFVMPAVYEGKDNSKTVFTNLPGVPYES